MKLLFFIVVLISFSTHIIAMNLQPGTTQQTQTEQETVVQLKAELARKTKEIKQNLARQEQESKALYRQKKLELLMDETKHRQEEQKKREAADALLFQTLETLKKESAQTEAELDRKLAEARQIEKELLEMIKNKSTTETYVVKRYDPVEDFLTACFDKLYTAVKNNPKFAAASLSALVFLYFVAQHVKHMNN